MPQLECDRAAAGAVPFDPHPCCIRHPVQRRAQILRGRQVCLERPFRADRLGGAVDAHGAVIDAACCGVEIVRMATEMRLQEREGLDVKVCARENAKPLHLLRGHRPYTMEAYDRQRLDERRHAWA
jgi:hypothetical protein